MASWHCDRSNELLLCLHMVAAWVKTISKAQARNKLIVTSESDFGKTRPTSTGIVVDMMSTFLLSTHSFCTGSLISPLPGCKSHRSWSQMLLDESLEVVWIHVTYVSEDSSLWALMKIQSLN